MTVAPERFSEFFNAVHGFGPFPWQEKLAARVTDPQASAGDPWPQCLALPTGSGKTACLDIALFALACQADLPAAERTAPRRIIFVVDRRVIVDEAFEHAVELAKKLFKANEGILKDVADALSSIAGHAAFEKFNTSLRDAPPLTCHQLRGGMYRDDAWARTPTQPCVIASTVDQIGSRILFRGYGTGRSAKQVHAGLAGNDSLIILDEAHCANPFLQTMQGIVRYSRPEWAENPLPRRFHFVVMSATPPKDVEVVHESDKDRNHPVLGRRIGTSKPIELIPATKAKSANWQTELAKELVKQAILKVGDERLAVAILVNRVATAKLVNHLLKLIRDKEASDFKPFDGQIVRKFRNLLFERCEDFCHELMTGRMRPIDKEAVADHWLKKLKANPNRDPNDPPKLGLERPVFITATQCLEVGANLDFDAMISECASLDALRQRFGRLNRVGRWDEASGVIVVREDQKSPKNSDPVYGESLARTWEWLNGNSLEGSDPPNVDFGVTAMRELIGDTDINDLVLKGSDAPVMLPAHVDCWVQTAPEPLPSPDVALFLHGPQMAPPEIQICWRADLPKEGESSRAIASVALCPPTTRECLSVPLHVFQHWWYTQSKTLDQELADVSARDNTEDWKADGKPPRWLAVIWRGPEKSDVLNNARADLRPGDTVVLSEELEGWSAFGHVPTGRPIDIADVCNLTARQRPILRLNPKVIQSWTKNIPGNDPFRTTIDELIKLVKMDDATQVDWSAIFNHLREVAGSPACGADNLQDVLNHVSDRDRKIRHPFEGYIIRGPRIDTYSNEQYALITAGETFSSEDDSSCDLPPICLDKHQIGVETHASAFGELSGMPEMIVRSLGLAARLHDLGKADLRFQAMLHGGYLLRAKLYNTALAKSQGLPVAPRERRHAAQRSQLPKGFRHELVSLQIVDHFPELLDADNETDRDLVLHLIASHHGHGRPFAPVIIDNLLSADSTPETDEFLDIALRDSANSRHVTSAERRDWTPPHRLDSGIAERFWRLVRRYGWWGLAWIEAVFVLADHRESEREGRQTITVEHPEREVAQT